MKNNYYLPGLNGDNRSEYTLQGVNKTDTPKLFLFINNADLFYKKYCNSLDNSMLREKRFIDFETPNRALITHEYDIEVENNFDYSKYYYLFNPISRLSWLKISQDGKRLSIAKECDIKENIYSILKEEIHKILVNFDELWSNRKGFPCFVKLKESKCDNFLITASYYDSIKSDKKEVKSFIFPLMERRIKYDYLSLIGRSSWLYVKSPNNFNVSYNQNINQSFSHYMVDFANSKGDEADPGKIALTIINKAKDDPNKTEDDSVKDVASLILDITVPSSLKTWFMSIYYMSITIMLILLSSLLNELYIFFYDPIFNRENLVDILFVNNNFGSVIMGLIAAIIATRGWLISEETITKYYSIYLTRIVVVILFLYSIIMIIL